MLKYEEPTIKDTRGIHTKFFSKQQIIFEVRRISIFSAKDLIS